MREHAVCERGHLTAHAMRSTDDRTFSRHARALHVLHHDAAPRQLDTEGHRADGVDDAGFRPVDDGLGKHVVTETCGEFSERASGGDGHDGGRTRVKIRER